MEKTAIPRILALYGVNYRQILAPQKGYRNSSYPVLTDTGQLNLIIYKSESDILARIQRTNQIGSYVATSGLPARRLYDPRLIKLSGVSGTKYAALYNYLPGQTIPWEAYEMEHLKAAGQMMAKMHAVLASYKQPLPSVVQESLELFNKIQQYFAQPGVQTALNEKLKVSVIGHDFTKLFHELANLPGQQALHMDFVRGNILFDGKQISGILDFEKAAYGHPLFDLARTTAFLLVDCKYKSEDKVRKYFLYSGYQKRGNGMFDISVRNFFEELVLFYLLHDFYKFLRHNPYQALPMNEHFVRTKAILLHVGLITEE